MNPAQIAAIAQSIPVMLDAIDRLLSNRSFNTDKEREEYIALRNEVRKARVEVAKSLVGPSEPELRIGVQDAEDEADQD